MEMEWQESIAVVAPRARSQGWGEGAAVIDLAGAEPWQGSPLPPNKVYWHYEEHHIRPNAHRV